MHHCTSKILINTILILTIASPSILFISNTWYDQQRIILIAVIALSTLIILIEIDKFDVSVATQTLLLAIIAAGIISSIQSAEKIWGLTEVSLIVGCAAISLSIRSIKERYEERIFLSIFFICFIKIVQTLTAYLSFLVSDKAIFEQSLFFDGFSNIRFFGQLQTFTIPLLAIPLMAKEVQQKKLPIKKIFFFFLATWWAIAFFNGTRGTIIGIFFSILALPFITNYGKKWSLTQIKAVALGGVIYWLFFKIISGSIHPSLEPTSTRSVTSLSLRDIIWRQAFNIIFENPWFGIGPMNLSNTSNSNGVAAHPHQAVLQIAAEWGIPALIFCIILTAIYFAKSVNSANKEGCTVKTCVLAAIISAAIQSMVDGIIVTPYSQQLLAILLPLTLSKKNPNKEKIRSTKLLITLILISSINLTSRIFLDQDRLKTTPQETLSFSGNLQPRFWCQGINL